MKELNVKQLEEQLYDIMDKYDQGDDTHYLITLEDGKQAVMVPYDGPWTTTVKEAENGDAIVEFPNRLVAKSGFKEGDELEYEEKDGGLFLRKKTDGNG